MNMQKKTFLALLSALTLMSGCGGSNSSTDTQQPTTPEVIHGYTLPPEPNLAINNSTLLGIDSNNNGVRDDVEIWILKKYKDEHPIYTEIAMQVGRAWQKVLEDPTKAKEIHDFVNAAGDCESYYSVCSENNSTIHIEERIDDRSLEEQVLNTKARKEAYSSYDSLLSGDSYRIPWCSERKQLCDFNVTKFEQLP